MSSGSGQQPVTQTQTSDPWSGAQPHLQNVMAGAANLYSGGQGYIPYQGQLQPDVNRQANLGLQGIEQMATANLSGGPGVNAALAFGQNALAQGGLSPEQRGVAGQMQGTFGNLGNVYSEASGQQNPYLLAQIAANDRRIADRVNASMSGAGRYGSGAHTDVMARSLAEAANPILAQDYTQRQQTRLGALQGQTGTAQALNQLYGGGQELAGKWGQLIPSLEQAQYAPSEKLLGVGQFGMDRESQALANAAALYNAQQAYPWEQLQRYQGIISGTGGLGGTKVTSTTPYTPSTLQRVGGGALAGAGLGSMFGPMGAGVGAAGGGLLGLL